MSHSEVAKALGRSHRSVEKKLARLRQDPIPPPRAEAEPEDLAATADFWKRKARELQTALDESKRSQVAAEIVAEQMLEMAPKSYSSEAPPTPISDGHHSPQSAVLLLSDSHIGAVVAPEQTLGLGGYNFETFLRRLARLERSIFSIIRDHTTTVVPEIVVPILGDMLDGALVHSAESGQPNSLLSQFYSGGHALAQFLRNLTALAPVRTYACVGNHTRWQNQHKMPSKNRNSNYDMLLYLYAQALTREVKGLTWNLDWQPFATFEVQGHPFYCGHGENLRGGDRILGLPAHSMGRMVSTTTQLFTRAGRDIPAYYCVGHLHRPIEIPHSNGYIIVNGAFPGIDGFALNEYFNSSYPMQKFFLMHPHFGRSACYDLRLDLGDAVEHHYSLPEAFLCK